jgi:hypothetical protein
VFEGEASESPAFEGEIVEPVSEGEVLESLSFDSA